MDPTSQPPGGVVVSRVFFFSRRTHNFPCKEKQDMLGAAGPAPELAPPAATPGALVGIPTVGTGRLM